jgi:hypothetical protein
MKEIWKVVCRLIIGETTTLRAHSSSRETNIKRLELRPFVNTVTNIRVLLQVTSV